MGEELDRLTSTFAALIAGQQRQLTEGIRSMADALRRAADRLADLAPQAGTPAATAPVVPVAAGAPVAVASSGAVLNVRVTNDSGNPIPVIMARGGQAEERPARGGGFWGALSGIAGGIGSLIGGLVGGFLGGGVGGPIMGAELIIALPLITRLVDRVERLLAGFYAFGLDLLRQLGNLVTLLFTKLTEAGIFPISNLFATLLVFIDLGVAVVLAHLRVVIEWVRLVAETLVTWLGRVVGELSGWIERVADRLAVFAERLVAGIVRDAVRSLAESLGAVLLGSALAMGAIISEAIRYAWELALNKMTVLLGRLLGLPPILAPPPPSPPDFGAAIKSGMDAGRAAAEGWVRGILGPPPGPRTSPRLRIPRLGVPELELPEFPQVTPQLGRLLGAQAPAAPPPTPGPAAPAAPAGGPVTLNGGITVQIAAQTVDREHADETARAIARSMLDELRRLTEQERLRSGLPTAAIH